MSHRASYRILYAAIERTVKGWAETERNARSIMRRSGFRPGAESVVPPTPILSLEGSSRGCFGPDRGYPLPEGAMALLDGKIWIWGYNLIGYGYNETESTVNYWPLPSLHPGGHTGVIDLAWGQGSGMTVLLSDGTLLYDGARYRPAFDTLTPLSDAPSGIVQVVCMDPEAPDGFTYMLRDDGTVWGFGLNGAGMSGNPFIPIAGQWYTDPTGHTIAQMPTSKVSGVVEMATNDDAFIFRKSDGTVGVWRWLATDPVYPSSQPSGVTKISGGVFHPVLLTGSGEIWGTGDNTFGQYGNGTTVTGNYASWRKANGTGYTDVAGLNQGVIAVKDGSLWTWGQGGARSARGASAPAASTPQEVAGTDGTIKVFGNRNSFVGMLQKDGGCVEIWGDNTYGWVGQGFQGGEFGSPVDLQASVAYPPWPA